MSNTALQVDFGQHQGTIRPLHGVNFGPLSFNGLHDFSAYHRQLRIPVTRLHDCPYAIPDTVDIHNLFPLFHADPADPRNFIFPITDDYLQSIKDVGSDIIFRLGETIEHHKRHKYFIHPPADFAKWAEICLQVIRHYNEGWANGFHHDITYWEIWNEPWALCWTGTPEQFYQLYDVTARRIKAHNPALKVGSGGSGTWDDFCEGLVSHCRETQAPLDFLVWHTYQHHPRELARLAREMRERLTAAGFPNTELHLNEWAHNPDNNWSYLSDGEAAAQLVPRLQGAQGAAYTATVLAWLQDLPIDVAAYYWAREDFWGLFDNWGRPTKIYAAFEAFVSVLNLGDRVPATGSDEDAGRAVLAAISADRNEAAVLVSNFASDGDTFELSFTNLPWDAPTEVEILLVDDQHGLETIAKKCIDAHPIILQERIDSPSVRLYRLRKKE